MTGKMSSHFSLDSQVFEKIKRPLTAAIYAYLKQIKKDVHLKDISDRFDISDPISSRSLKELMTLNVLEHIYFRNEKGHIINKCFRLIGD